MKKFLGLVFVLAFVFTLISCAEVHTHAFSNDWSHDAKSHWHAATCEHTDEVSKKMNILGILEKLH